MLTKINDSFMINPDEIRYLIINKTEDYLYHAYIKWKDGELEKLLLGDKTDAQSFMVSITKLLS